MNVMRWIVFLVIIAALFIHGFWPDSFSIDEYSIALLILIAIPLIAPFVKELQLFGTRVIFKSQIERLSSMVNNAIQEAQYKIEAGAPRAQALEAFSTRTARHFLRIDSSLSLAALRIEIESVLEGASRRFLNRDIRERESISSYIWILTQENIITPHQRDALNTILELCNKAIHGSKVDKAEAEAIISLTERLNSTLPFAVE